MTARELYTYALIEINKLEAPSMLLEDYNYLINKSIQQYVNKTYNRFDINQQSTDDLRMLQVYTEITQSNITSDVVKRAEIVLPDNYLHLLNCIAIFNKSASSSNYCGTTADLKTQIGCKKITADQLPSVLQNYYMQPTYDNPYYLLSRNKVQDILSNNNIMEILYGVNDKVDLEKVLITYIKTPEQINLDYEDLEGVDSTQILEFPEYVCYEIINEFTKLLLENSSDPRLNTHIPINMTIPGNLQT